MRRSVLGEGVDERFRSLVEHAGVAVATSDLKGRLTYANRALADLLGYTVKELVGRPFEEFIHPDDRGRVTRLFLNIIMLRRHPRDLEFRALRKDGRVLHLWSKSTRFVVDGKTVGFQAIIVDMTERVLTEKRWQESERRYRELADSLPQIVFEMDRDGVLTFANRNAFEVFGYTRTDFKRGLTALQMLIPEDRERARQNIQKVLKGERLGGIEYTALRKDGSTFPVLIHPAPITREKEIVGVRGIIIDISERKQMLDELRRLEERYRMSLENMLEGCQMIGFDWRYLYVNDTAARHGRRAKEELLGRTMMEAYPGIENTELFAALKRCMNDRVSHRMENRFRYPDGSEGWFDLSIYPVPEGIFILSTEITEKKRMEEELRRHVEHLEELVEERTKEVRELNKVLTQRLTQKISQIINISKARDKVRRAPDLSSALNRILEEALDNLGMDAGAILAIDREKNIAIVRSFKSKIEGLKPRESYPLDARFAGCEAIKEGRNLSRIVEKDEPRVFESASVHCAPIYLGQETYGALILGSQKAEALDDTDLIILGSYAELASSAFQSQSISIKPVKEAARHGERRFKLEFGNAYLVKNDVAKAYEVFADHVLSGHEGLCVTREFPDKVRRKYGLEKTPIIWLSEEKTEGQVTVYVLQDLSILLGDFLEKTQRGVVLLDGFEYLITNNGFEPFLRFLQLNRSRFEMKESILIAPITESALNEREVKLLEREMQTLTIG
ncbi:MAG: PAS domain S-box protein [Candidatus Bathyarchaeia archaeon]